MKNPGYRLIILLVMAEMLFLSLTADNQYNMVEIARKKKLSLAGKGQWIGNCHSYTLWQLTGKKYIDVSFDTILKTLNNLKYQSLDISTDPHSVILETGDVVTFGTAHSGYVLVDGKVSHLRKTQAQEVFPDGSFAPRVTVTLPVDPRYLDRYPGDYLTWLHKLGAKPQLVQKAVKEKRIGFFHLRDSIRDIQNTIPAYADTRRNKILWWRKPDQSITGLWVFYTDRDCNGRIEGSETGKKEVLLTPDFHWYYRGAEIARKNWRSSGNTIFLQVGTHAGVPVEWKGTLENNICYFRLYKGATVMPGAWCIRAEKVQSFSEWRKRTKK